MKKCLILFALLFIAYTSISQDNRNFTGRWQTSNGNFDIIQDTTSVYGYYDYNSGEISGTANNDSLYVTFIEYIGGYVKRGYFELNLSSDGKNFTGIKKYYDEVTSENFPGLRLKCDISGKVRDSDEEFPMEGVEMGLTAWDNENHILHRTKTDENGRYTFNVYSGKYIIKPLSELFFYDKRPFELAVASSKSEDNDFWTWPNAYLSISSSKNKAYYQEEVRIQFEIKDEDSVLIPGTYQVKFQEINENMGSFIPEDGMVEIKNGVAEIIYILPDETEAKEWKHFKVKATLLGYSYDDNYKIQELELGEGFPCWAEPRHSNNVILNSRIAIIPANGSFPAVLFAKPEDKNGNPLINHDVEFTLQGEKRGFLWDLKYDRKGSTISMKTNEEGIAKIHYFYDRDGGDSLFVQKITVNDDANNNLGVCEVWVGLGLRITELERYRKKGGIIVSGTKINIVANVESDYFPNLNLSWYQQNAREKVWEEIDKEFGLWFEMEWINRPWWIESPVPDIVFKGRCSFYRLGDKNVLKALDEPSDIVANKYWYPQFIPRSKGNHTYFCRAWIQNNKIGIRSTEQSINFRVNAFTTNVEIDSYLRDLACSLNPTSKEQIVMIFIAKKMMHVYASIAVEIMDVACKIANQDNFDAIISAWTTASGAFIDYNKHNWNKKGTYYEDWSADELDQLLRADNIKSIMDYAKLATDLYGDKTWKWIFEQFYGSNKSASIIEEDDKDKFTSMLLAPSIGIATNPNFPKAKNVVLLNGSNVKALNNNVPPDEVILDGSTMSEFMFSENNIGYSCFFRKEDNIDFKFDTKDKGSILVSYNNGDKGYKLFDLIDYPNASCRIGFDNTNNEILEVDADNDGNYETKINAEIVGDIGGNGAGDTNLSITWLKSIGGSGADNKQDLCVDSYGNIYLLAKFSESPVVIGGSTVSYSSNEDFFVSLIKFTPQGELQWYKTFDGCYPQAGLSVDSYDNIYVGLFVGDDGFRVNETQINHRGAVLLRYDKNGEKGFARNIIQGEKIKLYDLEIDQNDNIYLAGRFEGIAISEGHQFVSITDYDDWFVAKYNHEREYLWFKTAASIGDDYINDITITDSGLIVNGYFAKRLKFDSTEYIKSKSWERFISFIDFNGNEEWIHFLKAESSFYINDVVENDESYVVFFRSPDSSEMFLNSQSLLQSNGFDIMRLVIDKNGTAQSVNMTERLGNQSILSVDKYSDDKYLASGYFTKEIWNQQVEQVDGKSDGFIARLDADFQPENIYTLSIPGINSFDVVKYDATNKNIISAGRIEHDFMLNGESIQNKGEEDILLVSFKEDISTNNSITIKKEKIEKAFEIFPNPASNRITIHSNLFLSEEVEINIWNIQGVNMDKLRTYSLRNEKQLNYDVSHLTPGIYIVGITAANKRFMKRFVVDR